MADPFIGEIRLMSFAYAPQGWALCNGQLLPINQNQALFSLLGTTYGGNGITNFALPNMQGRVPISFDAGHSLGQAAGSPTHTLSTSEMPAHIHVVNASSALPTTASPSGSYFAANGSAYAAGSDTTMSGAAVTNVGGSQAHNNMSPYLVLSFCIALQGIFPSRN